MQHIFQASPAGSQYTGKGSSTGHSDRKDETLEMSLREHLLAAARGGSPPPINSPTTDHEVHSRQLHYRAGTSPMSSSATPITTVHTESSAPAGSPPSPLPPMHSTNFGQPNSFLTPLGVGMGPSHYNTTAVGQPPVPAPVDPQQQSLAETIRSRVGRPLSNTKRAAQNRAAQRAFRQRKEEYIKFLQKRVNELEPVAGIAERLRMEISELRNYALVLQSKLLSLHGECPTPPTSLHMDHNMVQLSQTGGILANSHNPAVIQSIETADHHQNPTQQPSVVPTPEPESQEMDISEGYHQPAPPSTTDPNIGMHDKAPESSTAPHSEQGIAHPHVSSSHSADIAQSLLALDGKGDNMVSVNNIVASQDLVSEEDRQSKKGTKTLQEAAAEAAQSLAAVLAEHTNKENSPSMHHGERES